MKTNIENNQKPQEQKVNDSKGLKGWREYKLEEIGNVLSGGTPNTNNPEFWIPEIPWITPKDLSNYNKRYISSGERFISKKGLENSNAKLLPKGTVLLSSRAPIGYIAIAENDIATNQGFQSIVTNNKVFNEFLYYLLKANSEYLKSLGEGTTFGEISNSTVKSIKFKFPPLPEQKAIAAVLSSLDDKIDLLHRQNKTLEAMAETLFRQWFVKDKEIRTIQLGDIINIYDSKRKPLSSTERAKMKSGTLYPYYGAANIMDYINDYIFDGEYLLLGEDGTVQTDDGFPILQMAVGKFWANNHTHVIEAKKPFSNFLLYIILKNTAITHIVTGAVQPKINQENLKSLEIDIPSDKLIIEAVTITNNFWGKINQNNSQIRTLEKLRDLLLPKLISGEIRVQYE